MKTPRTRMCPVSSRSGRVALSAVFTLLCAWPVQAQPGGLDLADCRQIALQQQPSLIAAWAELRVAEIKAAAVEEAGPVANLSRELPLRKEQARLGLQITRSVVAQTEADVVYDVTRLYYALRYARSIEELLEGAVRANREQQEHLKKAIAEAEAEEAPKGPTVAGVDLRQALRGYLGVGDPIVEWRTAALELVRLFGLDLQVRLAEARRGVAVAESALKEAMGLPPESAVCFLTGTEFPEGPPAVSRADVVGLALARNGDLVRASLAAEIFRLEVEVQKVHCLPGTVNTLAATTDLHATTVSGPERGEEYRPGALSANLPTSLTGPRETRVRWMNALADRAGAVAVKSRNLIALRAEVAYRDWEAARAKLPLLREADRIAGTVTEADSERLFGGDNVVIETFLAHSLFDIDEKVELLQVRLDLVIALADMERVTAGGFRAGLVPVRAGDAPNVPLNSPAGVGREKSNCVLRQAKIRRSRSGSSVNQLSVGGREVGPPALPGSDHRVDRHQKLAGHRHRDPRAPTSI